jgi:hypothetical protein
MYSGLTCVCLCVRFRMDVTLSDMEVDFAMQEVDVDGSGEVGLEELREWIVKQVRARELHHCAPEHLHLSPSTPHPSPPTPAPFWCDEQCHSILEE